MATDDDQHPGRCTHPRPHRTGEFLEGGRYRQTCDLCGADTTDEVEGAEAEWFIRKLRGEQPQ